MLDNCRDAPRFWPTLSIFRVLSRSRIFDDCSAATDKAHEVIVTAAGCPPMVSETVAEHVNQSAVRVAGSDTEVAVEPEHRHRRVGETGSALVGPRQLQDLYWGPAIGPQATSHAFYERCAPAQRS